MLTAKDFRQEAWKKLNGKWGAMVLITLIYLFVLGVGSVFAYTFIGALVPILIVGPLTLGFTIVSINIIRMKPIEVSQVFDGFRNFGNALLACVLNGLFIFLWSLLFIVPGIIKAYEYSMTYYILADNPAMSATEARNRSIELMRGNKWRLFCLQFSFIGWWILCGLTCGILSLWVVPYMQSAVAAFYQSLLPTEEINILK